MIDWHTHILPAMDDGSRDGLESLAMLETLATQKIQTVIATPHFYADDEPLATFLERRQQAMERLQETGISVPRVLLGAEVRYYQGISRLEKLQDLRIEGRKLLLLEMPVMAWSEYTLRELAELSGKSGIKIVLAHIERYLRLQKQSAWERLYESGILMQVNASFLTACTSRHRAITLLKEGGVHFIGSDCHNTASRAPKIGKAFEILEKKLGCEYVSQFNEYGNAVLAEKA